MPWEPSVKISLLLKMPYFSCECFFFFGWLVGFLFPFKKGNMLVKWQLDSNWGIGLIMEKML